MGLALKAQESQLEALWRLDECGGGERLKREGTYVYIELIHYHSRNEYNKHYTPVKLKN